MKKIFVALLLFFTIFKLFADNKEEKTKLVIFAFEEKNMPDSDHTIYVSDKILSATTKYVRRAFVNDFTLVKAKIIMESYKQFKDKNFQMSLKEKHPDDAIFIAAISFVSDDKYNIALELLDNTGKAANSYKATATFDGSDESLKEILDDILIKMREQRSNLSKAEILYRDGLIAKNGKDFSNEEMETFGEKVFNEKTNFFDLVSLKTDSPQDYNNLPKQYAFKLFLEAANLGLVDAQYETALAYYDGNGTEQNKTEALLWYKQAAKQGHKIAQKMVANWKDYGSIQAKFESNEWHLELAKQGNVTEQYLMAIKYSESFRMVEAFNWFKEAANKDFIAAQYEIAERYLFGIGTEKNPQTAFQLFMKITKQKAKTKEETIALETYMPKAKFMLGKCYEEGLGTAKNPQEAFKFYLETAQSDFKETADEILKDASYKTALFYFDGIGTNKDRNEAKQWYEKSAKYGHLTAKKMLEHWEEYKAIPDKYESLTWHKKLAEQGNAEAQNILGTISENQYQTNHQKNKKAAQEAFQWYKKSAEQGNAEGEYNLARCYFDGFGVDKNEDVAFSYFTKSAEQNLPDALREIGNCCYTGSGTMKNNTKAIEYYTKAAELGDIKAQMLLADIYQKGEISEKNYEKAQYWYRKAAESGVVDAVSKANLREEVGFRVLWEIIKHGKLETLPILADLYMNSESDYDDEAITVLLNSLKVTKNNKILMESNEKIGRLFWKKNNEKEAFKWFSKAAQQGSAYPQYVVGLHYLCKENNKNHALTWLQKSAKQGDYDAKMMINLLNFTKKISDSEKRKIAKEMVAELKKQGYSDYHAQEWTAKMMMLGSLGVVESNALLNKIKNLYLQGTIYSFKEQENEEY